jgi:hypothetical protein
MVSRSPCALILLALAVMIAPPAAADDCPDCPPEPIPNTVSLPGGPCNIAYVMLTFPFVEIHPECIDT